MTKIYINHLWYLGGELVIFCLFDDNVSLFEKYLVVENLKTLRGEEWSERQIRVQAKSLADLVTSVSLCALKSLKLNIRFYIGK